MIRRFWQVCALSFILGGTAQAGTVTAYTALEEDEIAEYVAAAKRGLPDVDLKVVGDRPMVITGDRDLLFDAVANLVDNAIKHGREAGQVTVELSRSDADADSAG